MAWIESVGKVTDQLKKHRYALLILVIGIVLMMLPGKATNEKTSAPVAETVKERGISVNAELAQILSKIQGVGEVQVMLTVKYGQETMYQLNSELTETSNVYTTVILSDSDRNETGLIRQINPPTYLGAIVICQGGDDPTVRLAVTEAVADITGLRSDCISVLKMK